MIFKYPIAISLSPNTDKDDIWQAYKTIMQPWNWKDGTSIKRVEERFKQFEDVDNPIMFNSGRSALLAILVAFDIGKGDEVLIQAFTCVAVPDAILWAGANPIYVDIDDSLNIDPMLLEKHINKKTKAIVVQHTFGIPARIELIKKIAQKYNLILIEDCAHSLGATFNGITLGKFGDATFFSFGRDKVVSSVFGGMATIKPKFKMQNSKLKKYHENLPYPGTFWIFQQLLHPILLAIILPLYNFQIGKVILFASQKFRLLSFPVYEQEKKGTRPEIFPARFPNALAQLILLQLNKLETYNRQREKNATYYFRQLGKLNNIKLPPKIEGAIYLRFNILMPEAQKLLSLAKERKILLGNWYRNVIDPIGVDFEKVRYKNEQCPNAERVAKLSLNLPTYPRLTNSDLKSVVDLIRQVLHAEVDRDTI